MGPRFFQVVSVLSRARVVVVLLALVAHGAVAGAGDERSFSQEAWARYQEGNWRQAVENYRESEESLDPRDMVRYGEALLGVNDYAAAEIVLERVRDHAEPHSETFLRAQGARIYLDALQGEPEPPQAALQTIVEQNPESYWARIYLARVLKRLGRWEDALSQLFDAKQINPREYRVHFEIGEVYETLFLFDLAMESYEESLHYNPRFAQALNNLGYCYKEKSVLFRGVTLYSYAVEKYLEAIAIQPDNAGFYYNLGNAYTHLGKLDKAFDAYSLAVELEPTFAKAHFNLGRTWQKFGRLEEAIREFELYLKYGNQAIFNFVEQPETVRAEIEAMKDALALKPD